MENVILKYEQLVRTFDIAHVIQKVECTSNEISRSFVTFLLLTGNF